MEVFKNPPKDGSGEDENPSESDDEDDDGVDTDGDVGGKFNCDVCGKSFPVGTTLHGCRTCDWDACEDCVARLGMCIQPCALKLRCINVYIYKNKLDVDP